MTREPTPEQLAVTTIWSAADWQQAYDAWSWRPDWPQLARLLVDLRWHPGAWRRLNPGLVPVEDPSPVGRRLVGRFGSLLLRLQAALDRIRRRR